MNRYCEAKMSIHLVGRKVSVGMMEGEKNLKGNVEKL